MNLSSRKPCAVFLVLLAAVVAANMWVVGLVVAPGGNVQSPGGYMSAWTWINPLYAALCGYYFARLSAGEPSRSDRRLRVGFGVVAVGCVLNLAAVDLAGIDAFWIWHFIDAVLVATFLGQAVREWKSA